jgi:hypothetical protein
MANMNLKWLNLVFGLTCSVVLVRAFSSSNLNLPSNTEDKHEVFNTTAPPYAFNSTNIVQKENAASPKIQIQYRAVRTWGQRRITQREIKPSHSLFRLPIDAGSNSSKFFKFF